MDEPRGRRLGQGGEPWLRWTETPVGFVSDVEDYIITRLDGDEYQLSHGDERVLSGGLAETILLAEMNRCLEVPDGR